MAPLIWHLGDVVRKLREAKTPIWNQKVLAHLAGVKQNTLGRLERGQPVSPGTMEKVASALGVTVLELYLHLQASPGGATETDRRRDAIDAETIARFDRLSSDKKVVVRTVIDGLLVHPDRPRANEDELADQEGSAGGSHG